MVIAIMGLLSVVFIACNSSAKGIENKANEMKTPLEIPKTDEKIADEVKETKKPLPISSEQFVKWVADYHKEWKYKGDKPCVVDFHADWCRPCRMMEPAFVKMAEKYAGKINFYKVNIDENKEISNAYQITGIPTLFFCSLDGKLTRIMGYRSEEQLQESIEMMLKKHE